MSSPKPTFEAAPGGVRVTLRVTPKASRAGAAGLAVDARGRHYVKLRVNAPAQDGKANAALLKLLAKQWGLARSNLRIIGGARAPEIRSYNGRYARIIGNAKTLDRGYES